MPSFSGLYNAPDVLLGTAASEDVDVPNGVCGLDGDGLVPLGRLPSGIGGGGSGTGGNGLQVSAVKTANFTTTAGFIYPCNTTAGSFTITLHTPVDKDKVAFYDAKSTGSFGINNLTIDAGPSRILDADILTLKNNYESLELVYSSAEACWAIVNAQTVGSSAADVDLATLQGRVDVVEVDVDNLKLTLGALTNVGSFLKPLENVYIAPDNDQQAWTPGIDPVAYYELRNNAALQTSDPEATGFRAFRSLEEAAKYCQENLSSEGLAVLYLKPGIYYQQASFNCSILINGINNSGDVGDYNDPLNSVILYQRLDAVTRLKIDGSYGLDYGINRGQLIISGKATSTIKNCHFWGSNDWLSYSGKTIISIFQEALDNPSVNGTYKAINLTHPLVSNSRIKVENGTLVIDNIVTIGAGCPSSYNFNATQQGLFDCKDATLNIYALRLRGNGLWIMPTSLQKPDTTVVPLFDDTWDGWAKCDVNGVLDEPLDPDSGYRCAAGFANTLFVFRGSCRFGLGTKRYILFVEGVGPEETGTDKNSVRLERNWPGKFGGTDTNYFTNTTVTPDVFWQGSDNLGIPATTDFYNDAKFPSIRYCLSLPEANSSLKLLNYFWNVDNSNSAPGFRGSFGTYCDITNSDNAQLSDSLKYKKPVSLFLYDKAFGITLEEGALPQYFNTLWMTMAEIREPSANAATIQTTLNILATDFTQRKYLNLETCTDTGYYSGFEFTDFALTTNFTW